MSMLTGKQINREVERGRICIDPFDPACLNANSYNLKLSNQLLVHEKNLIVHLRQQADWEAYRKFGSQPADWQPLILEPMDMKVKEATIGLCIPEQGLTLWPGALYLAATIETAGADVFIPCIEGRSSVGRLGICVHVTAGFGDLSFSGPANPANWTLELTVVHPIIVYAGVAICQIAFTTPKQDRDLGALPAYKGKYSGQRGPKSSGLWKDFHKEG
jgi:dCTP deaminase